MKLLEFLNLFNDDNGQYVSWKNNHEIDLVIEGQSDLDIFVPEVFKKKFFKIAKEQNWIVVKNPVADYPEVYHFFALDENLKNHHLHVYFKVITGESWLKEYDFPLDQFLLDNKVAHPSGIFVLNNKAQSYLFVLRHFLKGYSFSSRLLYQQELVSYQQEWELCKVGFNPKVNPSFLDFSTYMAGSGLENGFSMPQKSFAKSVRNELEKYLRFPKRELAGKRFQSFKTRFLNKLFYKEKKILPHKGIILAFSGADGVGKSTMSESIRGAYQKFLTVKGVELGKPQSRFVEDLRKLINKPVNKVEEKIVKPKEQGRQPGYKKAVSAVFLAYLRYKEAKKAKRYRDKNYMVISDRWPTTEHYKMDGPKLEMGKLQGLKKQLARMEQKYYKKITRSDLTIILTVPVTVAVKRNQDRIKEDKETDEEIRQRHTENAQHHPKAHKIIQFDNNGALSVKRMELLNLIQKELYQEV